MNTRTIPPIGQFIILLVALCSALAGCVTNPEINSSPSTNTTISLWVRDTDRALPTQLVRAYNAQHSTKVKLLVFPADSFIARFRTAIAAGTPPDLAAVDLVYMPSFERANEMSDITTQAHRLPFYDQLSPSHLRLATYQDKIYGLPFSADSSVLLYNKKLFQQAGLDPNRPPTTWAEIEYAARKITALGNGIKGYVFAGRCAGCNAFTLLPLIWASGGAVLNTDGSVANLTSPPVRNAMSFYRRLWTEGLIPPEAEFDTGIQRFYVTSFEASKVGMTATGGLDIAFLKANHPQIDFGVSPLPGEYGGHASFAGGDTIGIPRGSSHPQAAFDFISWCLSSSVQLNLFAKNYQIPVRADLGINPYSQQDPRYKLLANSFIHGQTPYSPQYNQLFNDENGPWITAIETAVFDGQIDAALTTAQQRFTQILATSS